MSEGLIFSLGVKPLLTRGLPHFERIVPLSCAKWNGLNVRVKPVTEKNRSISENRNIKVERTSVPASCAKWDGLIVVFNAVIAIFRPILQISLLEMGNPSRLTFLRKVRRLKPLPMNSLREKIVSFAKILNTHGPELGLGNSTADLALFSDPATNICNSVS